MKVQPTLRPMREEKKHHVWCRDCDATQNAHYTKACMACGSNNVASRRGGQQVDGLDRLDAPTTWADAVGMCELDTDVDEIEMFERHELRPMTMAEVRERLLWERGGRQ
jgi:ribosomal protein L37E